MSSTTLYKVVEHPNSLDHSITMQPCMNEEGHYIGNIKTARFLCEKMGIRPELISPDHNVCSIGWCEAEQKWYGWSHRAIYGFGIGSWVKPGDCAYTSDTPEGLIDQHADFFNDSGVDKVAARRAECWIPDERNGIWINHRGWNEQYGTFPVVEMKDAVAVILGEKDAAEVGIELPKDWGAGIEFRPCGRGEWEAKTLNDAKQMAVDFANDVA